VQCERTNRCVTRELGRISRQTRSQPPVTLRDFGVQPLDKVNIGLRALLLTNKQSRNQAGFLNRIITNLAPTAAVADVYVVVGLVYLDFRSAID
jgi:hypothetical protein